MAKVKKTIGRVPTARFEYTDGETYYSGNIVTRYGSAFQCNVESTTTPPATLDASGKVTPGEGWIFFADASGVEDVKNGVAALERDLGQYAELPSVTMTAETTGKYINADGEFVDDADFNIAAIGAVVVGNTYELYMSSADKMKLGVALFVARIKTTTTSGTERIKYVPLFSAMSTDIPTSGYVCFEAMEAYSDVLVCYRADVPEAATLLVRRYGTKASIATQINNLREKVDLKSFADGYYESMRVGTADNLTSKGDATEEVIMSRRAGGDNQIEDGSASIKRIKGSSVVWNQKLKELTADNTAVMKATVAAVDYVNNAIKITELAVPENPYSAGFKFNYPFRLRKNDKVLYRYESKVSKDQIQTYWSLLGKTLALSNNQTCEIVSLYDNIENVYVAFAADLDYVGEYFVIENFILFNLTQMFGSGNEPTTTDDFAKRLGYDSINDVPYIPYNEGEIVSSFAEGIKTTDTEGKVSERKWSETLKKYFPDGLKSSGSVFDEITPTKAVRRIHLVKLSGLSWSYNAERQWFKADLPQDKKAKPLPNNQTAWANVICQDYTPIPYGNAYYNVVQSLGYDKSFALRNDSELVIIDSSFNGDLSLFKKSIDNKSIVYESKDIEETTYDELNLTEQVAEGGTEEAIITDGKTSTPLRADIVYPIDAYNTIKANKTNIGTLSSLNTASKTDLVSAINELAGKVGALEAKATESVTNETTE